MSADPRTTPGLAPRPGTYVLILRSRTRATLQIGRRGALALEPGCYAYVGSALGPGGLAARVGRHARQDKRRHWHIDYLREATILTQVWFRYDTARLEHHWAQILHGMPGMAAVDGFGCTDCGCRAHLFFARRAPRRADFAATAGQVSTVAIPSTRRGLKKPPDLGE